MDYWVISVAWNGVERTPLTKLFVTPFQANTFAENIRSAVGYVYTVRPATWREREERMFQAEGGYQLPVWEEEGWWRDVLHHFKDFYLHISLVDPASVAFTEDERKGEADRQTPMRPGKFLQKFLGAGPSGDIEHGPLKGCPPQVTKMQVAFYAQWHLAGRRPPSEDILSFTKVEEEFVRVYEEGPESCMMGKGWPFENHPVRVYAGGGLAMAFLTSASGDVIARALCWPRNKVFGRVYPTPTGPKTQGHYDELMARLKALGWTSITEDNSVFEGAKLRQLTNRYGSYLMPYLDNEYGVRDEYERGQSWWVMTHDEDHQDNTDGTMNSHEPDWHCECCEEGFSEDYDSSSVHRYWQGSGRSGYPRGEETWCSDCRDNNAFYCDGCDEYFNDRGNSIYANDGCTYEPNWFEANGGWRCSFSEEYYFKTDDPPFKLANGKLIHEDHLDQTFVCWATGLRWMREPSESLAVPGYHISLDGWAQHPVEWECVVPTMPDDPEDILAWATAQANCPGAIVVPVDPIVEEVYGRLSVSDLYDALTNTGVIEGLPVRAIPVITPISL